MTRSLATERLWAGRTIKLRRVQVSKGVALLLLLLTGGFDDRQDLRHD